MCQGFSGGSPILGGLHVVLIKKNHVEGFNATSVDKNE